MRDRSEHHSDRADRGGPGGDDGPAQEAEGRLLLRLPDGERRPGVNSDREAGPEERSIALYQAARYAEHCRVYAPLYRQITLEGIFSGEPISAEQRDLSYNDVVDAWKTYLSRYNNGRGVILIGHSQGTYVLRQLIAQRIDKRKGVRKRSSRRSCSAATSTVEEGGLVDGDFRNIPGCTASAQTGCAIAFSTFNSPVPDDARFGRPGSAVFLPSDPASFDVLCSNPANLRAGAGQPRLVLPSEPFAPGTHDRRWAPRSSASRSPPSRSTPPYPGGGRLPRRSARRPTTPTSCRSPRSAERPSSTRSPTPPGASISSTPTSPWATWSTSPSARSRPI